MKRFEVMAAQVPSIPGRRRPRRRARPRQRHLDRTQAALTRRFEAAWTAAMLRMLATTGTRAMTEAERSELVEKRRRGGPQFV